MIKEIKRIKLEELDKQKRELKEQEKSIKSSLKVLEEKLEQLKKEQSNYNSLTKNFNFLERTITKRKDYKEYLEQLKKYNELFEKINLTDIELFNEKDNVKNKCLGIEKELDNIELQVNKINEAITLNDLGLSLIEAFNFLEKNGVQPILSEEDKVVYDNPRNYTSKSSLIGVHKTRYIPENNMIRTAKDSNVKEKRNITLNGVNYEYSFKNERNTIHMALNDEVSSHTFGSWDDCKYSILVPLEDIPNEKIGQAAPIDTFTKGSLELTNNAWILCPKEEVSEIKNKNPLVHVLGYEGENVKGFSKPFLTQLGYRGEDVGMWNWESEESIKQFCDLMKKEHIDTTPHSFTTFFKEEKALLSINQVIALSKLIRNNKLIKNRNDIEKIKKQLIEQYQDFGNILSRFSETSTNNNINEKLVDVFFERMHNNGFDFSATYKNIFKYLCLNQVVDEQADIFNIPSNATKEERKIVSDLKNNIKSSYLGPQERYFRSFVNDIIFESILNSKRKENKKTNITSDDLRKLRDNVELYLKQTEIMNNQEINEKNSHSK